VEATRVAVLVGEDRMKRNVGDGDGVWVGVLVGDGVSVGVMVGGIAAAVCEAAACAVCTTMVLTAPAGGGGGACAGISVDKSQLMSRMASARNQ
jgi:hypothetical protein